MWVKGKYQSVDNWHAGHMFWVKRCRYKQVAGQPWHNALLAGLHSVSGSREKKKIKQWCGYYIGANQLP